MDPDLLALANALVGNPLDTAVIEMAMVGPTFVCEVETCRIALAGAPFAMSLNGRILDPFTAHDLRRGIGSSWAPHGKAYGPASRSQGLRCGADARQRLDAYPHSPRWPRRQSSRRCDLLPLGAPKFSDRPLTLPLLHRHV